jgi:hypothetical protein
MNLVQVFIPSFDIGGARFETSYYKLVYDELLQQFGGLTAYPRAPATGLWTDDRKQIELDEIVVFEVMTQNLDRQWWAEYREKLEVRFAQEEVLIRVLGIERL